MTASGYLDSSKIAKQGEIKATSNSETDDTKDDGIIDYIFVSPELVNGVKNYNVSSSKVNGEWASNHNAITSVIKFPIS